MAQHISIQHNSRKDIQKIYGAICKSFEKGLLPIRSSLKFQEVFDDSFKISLNDKVFVTWRKLKNVKETFEIHFVSQNNKITEIFLVK